MSNDRKLKTWVGHTRYETSSGATGKRPVRVQGTTFKKAVAAAMRGEPRGLLDGCVWYTVSLRAHPETETGN